ncbi:MAG: agmatinase [Thermofilaceae archaeon]
MEDYHSFLVEPRRPTFLGFSSDPASAKVVILGVPYDSSSTCAPGCRYAPARVREVSHALEAFDPQLRVNVEELPVADVGDVVTSLNPEVMIKDVSKVVEGLLERGKLVACLGGDHTVTLGVLSGMKHPISMVVFDAHLDYRNEYPRGDRLSHATVLRRAREVLVKEAVVIGARAFSKEEVEALSLDDRVTVLHPWAGRSEIEAALSTLSRPFYVSIDIDVLDPSVAPGVGCPEPGGLNYYQILDILSPVFEGGVAGLDVVEVNPLVDVNDLTSRIAAKLLMRCLILLTQS